ncbi:MAG: lasso RiPP family leader peptide-containing protein [Egibacteraceae bacterium]
MQQAVELYVTPQVIELGEVAVMTLGKYAEDSADQGKYFE